MNVKIIHSGSSGNCATIDDLLIIDMGWDCSPEGKIVLITHHHGDHTKYLKNVFGLPFYALKETAEALQKKPEYSYTAFQVLETKNKYQFINNEHTYLISPVEMNHDVPCVGFDITRTNTETFEESRIFFATDFNSFEDEQRFVRNLKNKVYDAIYIEANNTLNPADFMDVYFPEEGEKAPRDEFHRRRSYQNHSNVDYILGLFKQAGYNEENKFTEPVTLLHKSSYYYPQNPERVVELCKTVKITNPVY